MFEKDAVHFVVTHFPPGAVEQPVARQQREPQVKSDALEHGLKSRIRTSIKKVCLSDL